MDCCHQEEELGAQPTQFSMLWWSHFTTSRKSQDPLFVPSVFEYDSPIREKQWKHLKSTKTEKLCWKGRLYKRKLRGKRRESCRRRESCTRKENCKCWGGGIPPFPCMTPWYWIDVGFPSRQINDQEHNRNSSCYILAKVKNPGQDFRDPVTLNSGKK